MLSKRIVASAAIAATFFVAGDLRAHQGDDNVTVTTVTRRPLPEYAGKEGMLVIVDYAPGHVDHVHRHPGHAFIYVLEGTVEMQMEGGKLHTLKPGDTFYEAPNHTHSVGRNVSKTAPAKLLVFFVTEQNVPLVLPPPPQ
jgi:quercetin dioxygenase-like cupin family protein